MVIVTQNTNKQTIYHLHCQLFCQRSAVTDTVQNAHHGGGTAERFHTRWRSVADAKPHQADEAYSSTVSRRQLTCRLAVEPLRLGRVLARTYPLQTGSHSASLSAEQGSGVPGRLLYTSLRHSQPTSFTVSHSTSPDRTTLPAQHLRSSGLPCRWSDGLELATGQSLRPGAHQQQLQTIAQKRTYFIVTTQHTQRSRDAPWVWGTTKSALYKYTYLYLS